MHKLSSLTIFFPSLNDAKSLPNLIRKADRVARQVTSRCELIVINDGSTDDTATILKQAQKRFKNLRVITHGKNLGYGAALISGFGAARYDWVFYTDGDGQYDPSELIKLVNLTNPTVDVVNGYKLNRADHWIRILIGSLYNRYAHVVTHLPISDVDCDFRLIRRAALANITLTSQSGTICVELISKLHQSKAIFAECAVHHYPRVYGKSEFFRISHLLETFKSITRGRF